MIVEEEQQQLSGSADVLLVLFHLFLSSCMFCLLCSLSAFTLLFSLLLSLASLPLLPPAFGVVVLQAACQEQVDSILRENDALRTNLAALEQVTNVCRAPP
ncbi:hypothetical protein ILYODFUR_028497 [Ilyodon furcidens]|uniref:Uncharacterized protein n=1 Tax=Ilyodon furcidens TaxID=33524 RepID=A0ABV0ST30_9TELE